MVCQKCTKVRVRLCMSCIKTGSLQLVARVYQPRRHESTNRFAAAHSSQLSFTVTITSPSS